MTARRCKSCLMNEQQRHLQGADWTKLSSDEETRYPYPAEVVRIRAQLSDNSVRCRIVHVLHENSTLVKNSVLTAVGLCLAWLLYSEIYVCVVNYALKFVYILVGILFSAMALLALLCSERSRDEAVAENCNVDAVRTSGRPTNVRFRP